MNVEVNPYNHKLTPGIWREAFARTFLEILRQNRKILASSILLSVQEKDRLSDLEEKLESLVAGEFVGQRAKVDRQSLKDSELEFLLLATSETYAFENNPLVSSQATCDRLQASRPPIREMTVRPS